MHQFYSRCSKLFRMVKELERRYVMTSYELIEDRKLAMRCAHLVWAVNKYYVLACSQQYYLKLRQHLKPDQPNLTLAFETLQEVEQLYRKTSSDVLPQLPNALYHIAGYFKNILTKEERQAVDRLIQDNPQAAIRQLEMYTFQYELPYLMKSRLWGRNRHFPFNLVVEKLTFQGEEIAPHRLLWHNDTVLKGNENE